jgi:hypothetical protein
VRAVKIEKYKITLLLAFNRRYAAGYSLFFAFYFSPGDCFPVLQKELDQHLFHFATYHARGFGSFIGNASV